ncbi:MAG: hypothetical protein AABZ53_08580 [Planctomycetota bacterium]
MILRNVGIALDTHDHRQSTVQLHQIATLPGVRHRFALLCNLVDFLDICPAI